jgi:hypothetical protein
LGVVGTSEREDAGASSLWLPFVYRVAGRRSLRPCPESGGSGVITSLDDGDFEGGWVAWGPGDGGFSSGAGFVVGGEVAEEGVAGLQVPASYQQAEAVTGAEEGRGGAERDHDLDVLVVANRLEGAEGVFGLVGCAEFGIELAEREAEPALGDAVASIPVGAVEGDRGAV